MGERGRECRPGVGVTAAMAENAKLLDDVVRIRIDVAWVVRQFLMEQSFHAHEDGGNSATANEPLNRGLFREIAPFRLVEYAYVGGGVTVEDVYIGFANGTLYRIVDDIPEDEVDHAVTGAIEALEPVYVYLLLASPVTADVVAQFMMALSSHLGKSLVWVGRDVGGVMVGHGHPHPDDPNPDMAAEALKCVLEANRHLSKERVLAGYATRSESPDGRAWAQVTYNFSRHFLEFQSTADRNDFVAWSRTLCEWVYARWCQWEDLGFSEVVRPAEPSPPPKGDEAAVVRLSPPSQALDGRAWQAFGGTDARSATRFADSDAAISQEALENSLILAREYWRYCTDAIDAVEAKARQQAEAQAKRHLKQE